MSGAKDKPQDTTQSPSYWKNKIFRAFDNFSAEKNRQGNGYKYYTHDDLLIQVRKHLAEKVPEAYMQVRIGSQWDGNDGTVGLIIGVAGCDKELLRSTISISEYIELYKTGWYDTTKLKDEKDITPEQHYHGMVSFAIKNLIRTALMLPTGDDEEGTIAAQPGQVRTTSARVEVETKSATIPMTPYQQLEKAIGAMPSQGLVWERVSKAEGAIESAEMTDEEKKVLLDQLKVKWDASEGQNQSV